ncbi:MAG: DUF1460 domain-containing protein [Gemmatimonadota bacterium]|nr:DUF1460 domain-containing protein [Gemmatimonadota bacterium]
MTPIFRVGAVLTALVVGGVVLLRGSNPEPDAPRLPDRTVDSQATWTHEDWDVFASKVRWARAEGLDRAEAGEAVGRLARSFVDTPYTPGTLEAEGPEGLVINFREFDCVTFVENMLAMTRFIRGGGAELLADPDRARATYEEYLTDLRYRGGRLDGYASRLHYFSEWLSDNAGRGLVVPVTPELDPALDDEPIDFMSSHPDAYRQLADPGVLAAIARMEERLNAAGPRVYVPESRIADIADRIRTGDVIAATSTVSGLDIAHTGLALWIDGRLHMVHAPLVGRSVEISEAPLAERIARISGQDGIMVARPIF